MSSRLAMKRLRRSASSWIVRDQLVLRRRRRAHRDRSSRLVAEPRIEASGVRRSCEIEVSSAERSRSVSAASRARSTSCARLMRSIASAAWSASASSSRRWSGVEQRPRPVAVEADDADRRRGRCAAAGTAAWRRAACRRRGRPAGCSPSTISPRRGRPRRARPRADSRRAPRRVSPSGSSSTTLHLQHRARSGRRSPTSRSSSVTDAGELAAEEVELLGRLGALARRHGLDAHARGQIAGDDRHDREEEQRDDVLGIGDGEGVERRQEEEIVGQHADQAGEQRRPQPVGDGARQHRGQEHQRDVRQLPRTAAATRPMTSATATIAGAADIGAWHRSAAARRRCAGLPLRLAGAASGGCSLGDDMDADVAGAGGSAHASTEPRSSSDQRERRDLAMTIWVKLLACA